MVDPWIFEQIQTHLAPTYLCSNLMRPDIGVHATFYKFGRQPASGPEVLKDYLARRSESKQGLIDVDGGRFAPRIIRTIGYWDALSLQYVDDFATLSEDHPTQNYDQDGAMRIVNGRKSYFGYLLACNSQVQLPSPVRDVTKLAAPPFLSLECDPPRGPTNAGVFVHYKMLPILLYTGRSELLVNCAQFISLLFQLPSEFWRHPSVRTIWKRWTHAAGSTGGGGGWPAPLACFGEISRLASGVEFLLYSNLDWNDFSLYMSGPSLAKMMQLSTAVRELPLAAAHFVFQLKRHMPGLSGILGVTKGDLDADEDKKCLLQFLKACRMTESEANSMWLKMPIFGDHLDVLSLPPDHTNANEEVQFVETVNVIPGQLHRLLSTNEAIEAPVEPSGKAEDATEVEKQRTEGESPGQLHSDLRTFSPPHGGSFARPGRSSERPFQIMSGPKELFREIGPRLSAIEPFESRESVASKWTYAFAEPSLDALVDNTAATLHQRIEKGMQELFNRKFGPRDLERLDEVLSRLRFPRQLTQSIRDLIEAHLSHNSDALMLNTLYDYLHLWKNLLQQLADTARRLHRAGLSPPLFETRANSDALAHTLRVHLEELVEFLDRVGKAINTRYHGSTRMFEVTDLNPNHQGGVDSFLDAYSELINIAFRTVRDIDDESHQGIVNVTTTPMPRIKNLFGTVVELDWLKLSSPESIFLVLHELGHQILKDPVFSIFAYFEEDPDYWEPVLSQSAYSTQLSPGQVGDQHIANRPAQLDKIRLLFSDVFCDLFLLRVTLEALVRNKDGSSDEPHRTDIARLLKFYDRWYWVQVEYQVHQEGGSNRETMLPKVVRWYLTRIVVESWHRRESRLDEERFKEIEQTISMIADHHRREGQELRRELSSAGPLFREDGTVHGREFSSTLPERRGASIPGSSGTESQGSPKLPPQFLAVDEDGENPISRKGLEKRLSQPLKICPSLDRLAAAHEESGEVPRLDFVTEVLLRLQELTLEDKEQYPADQFLTSADVHLRLLVAPDVRGVDLQPIADALTYCETLYETCFDQEGLAYARFTEDGTIDTRIDQDGTDPGSIYGDILINPRGTPFGRSEKTRRKLFSARLNIFNALAERRLESIAKDLVGLSQCGSEGD